MDVKNTHLLMFPIGDTPPEDSFDDILQAWINLLRLSLIGTKLDISVNGLC